MKLTTCLASYTEHLTHHKRLSVASIKAYHRDISKFIFSTPKQNSQKVQNMDATMIRQFFMTEAKRGISPKSLARMRSSIKNFCNYMIDQDNIPMSNNPTDLISTPKIRRKLPEVLDVDTVNRLLEISDNSEIALRDKALLELFYSSGLRLNELSHSKWLDIDMAQQLITVLGKGNKQRVIPVGKKAILALKKWQQYGFLWDKSKHGFVFISTRGTQLKPRSIQARIKYWAQKQGLWERVYPHLLRHSFASHVLESSSNLRAVQEMLGHADLSTTQIYTHLNFQHLAKVYDKTHPRARKKPAK
ncbi:MAG: tyrosine recombinase XerC [Proteobacteria bacterium]|nr:tyrosine recombinase XerC [Pseudomonadota bacterium]